MRLVSRVREREEKRILVRQSFTHVQRDCRSSSREGDPGDINERNRSRPRMGANDRNERKASFVRISGDVKRDDTDCGVGEGVLATVCNISPICRTTRLSDQIEYTARKMSQT